MSNGTAQLSTATNGVLSTNFTARTDIAGKVAGWIFIPTNSTTTNQITVTVTSGTNTTQMQMAASVVTPTAKTYSMRISAIAPPDPYAPAVALYWQNYDPAKNCIVSSGSGGAPKGAYDSLTNGELWLEITRVEPLTNSTTNVLLTLHNTTPSFDYELLSKTDLSELYWKPEQNLN